MPVIRAQRDRKAKYQTHQTAKPRPRRNFQLNRIIMSPGITIARFSHPKKSHESIVANRMPHKKCNEPQQNRSTQFIYVLNRNITQFQFQTKVKTISHLAYLSLLFVLWLYTTPLRWCPITSAARSVIDVADKIESYWTARGNTWSWSAMTVIIIVTIIIIHMQRWISFKNIETKTSKRRYIWRWPIMQKVNVRNKSEIKFTRARLVLLCFVSIRPRRRLDAIDTVAHINPTPIRSIEDARVQKKKTKKSSLHDWVIAKKQRTKPFADAPKITWSKR